MHQRPFGRWCCTLDVLEAIVAGIVAVVSQAVIAEDVLLDVGRRGEGERESCAAD